MRASILLPAMLTALLGPLAAVGLGLAGGPIRQLLGAEAVLPKFGLDIAVSDAGSRYMAWAAALLLALIVGVIFLVVRRRSALTATRGPAWDGGFMPPPPHLPFGDPLSQVSAAGLGQPIRRSLGGIAVAFQEGHLAQAPGAAAAAIFRVEGRDRGFTRILLPLARARRAVSREAEALRGLSLRVYLSLTFGTLVFLLALVAWLERG